MLVFIVSIVALTVIGSPLETFSCYDVGAHDVTSWIETHLPETYANWRHACSLTMIATFPGIAMQQMRVRFEAEPDAMTEFFGSFDSVVVEDHPYANY